MDFEKNVVNPELEDDDRQRVVQIMNNTKSQFVKDGSRELVASTNGVPALDDETIGYSRRKWRLKKKWYAKGKCWFYGIQYRWLILFGLGFWTYISKKHTKGIDLDDETWRTTQLARRDLTFDLDAIWFKSRDRATAFIEVIEAHRREKLRTEYLQMHPENIYL
jgi:hypothetical protein